MQERALRGQREVPTDEDLARAALAGDGASLGALLERHRAGLYASALAQLGSRERAADAVQETFVIALVKLHQLREPARVAGWLHVILRNECVAATRREISERVGLSRLVGLPDDQAMSPEQAAEGTLLREWVWSALGRLPESLQVTAMLRYFGRRCSYQEIADLCDVPVGTVRSRLHDARNRLGHDLLESTGRQLAGTTTTAAWQPRVVEAVAALQRGDLHPYANLFAPDVVLTGNGGQQLSGRDEVRRGLQDDLAAGVGCRLTGVFASSRVTVIETDFVNPIDDPDHCPPGVTTVLLHSGAEQAGRARGYFEPRSDSRAVIPDGSA